MNQRNFILIEQSLTCILNKHMKELRTYQQSEDKLI